MKIIDIKNYEPNSNDIFIFDSNIWVYLFDHVCYTPEYWEQQSIETYSSFYKKIINNNAQIYISSFNIEELIKKFIKHDLKAYNALTKSDKTYKEGYRNSESYSNLLEHVKNVTQKIFKYAIPINDKFETFNNSLFYNKGLDFVDEYLSFLSEKVNCKLVTHDRDFINCPFNIEILTDNKNLLKHCN